MHSLFSTGNIPDMGRNKIPLEFYMYMYVCRSFFLACCIEISFSFANLLYSILFVCLFVNLFFISGLLFGITSAISELPRVELVIDRIYLFPFLSSINMLPIVEPEGH